MFKIEGRTIHITRGDSATIKLSAKKSDGEIYTFEPNDEIRFNVFEKNNCSNVGLSKKIEVNESTSTIDICLTGEDTNIGKIINKPTVYWYEIELNPETNPQTIVGYDMDGATEFILYPEGKEE